MFVEPPFNMIITGPTNCGKTEYLMSLLTGPYYQKFEYVIFICPTFLNNKAYDKEFIYKDCDVITFDPDIDQIDRTLQLVCMEFKDTKTLLVLDDCASSHNMKKRTDELVRLGFSGGMTIYLCGC